MAEPRKHPHCIECGALINRWGGTCIDCQLKTKENQ